MENQTTERKVIFSAIQPSGTITLGNYLGALKNWVALQDDFDCIFALSGPAHHHRAAGACKIPPQHPGGLRPVAGLWDRRKQRACSSCRAMSIRTWSWRWILNCIHPVWRALRMTQFKDKSANTRTTSMRACSPIRR